MALTLIRTALMDNAFSGRIDKVSDIIGLDGLGLNVMLEVKSTAGSALPEFINVKLEVKEPHRGLKGMSSVPEPVVAPVFRFGGASTYRLSMPSWFFALKMIPEGQLEFATVVRSSDAHNPASADAGFRKPMLDAGWAWRGMGRQGKLDNSPSGNVGLKIPDAKKLMLAGGVELLEVSVPHHAGLILQDAKTWGFLRSPADVFFYTGHGQHGNLVTSEEIIPGFHDPWMSADKLVKAWNSVDIDGRNQFDIDVLIINGCSVLNCESLFSDGMKWARLLYNQEGPLYAILGYRAGAPSDLRGGHAVAVDMARRIASGRLDWLDFSTAWLEVNIANHAKFPPGKSPYSLANACAIDLNGYHTIDNINGRLQIKHQGLHSSVPILGT